MGFGKERVMTVVAIKQGNAAGQTTEIAPLQSKAFKECTLQFLEKTFRLEEVKNLPSLERWLAMSEELTEFEHQQLLYLQEILAFNVHDWNEHELDSHFIGPLFTFVNFSSKKFNHFAQRDLDGIVEGYRLFGKPDGIIASGRRVPETPYFAFQEYKRLLDPDGDPAAQALAVMLVGQQLDGRPRPLYGCYVVGYDWRFMTLEEKQYAVSQDYSALTDEVFAIFRILKGLKQIVIELTA
jgi:hypothetical protein